MNLIFLKDITIHSDWKGFLTNENQQLLQQIENTIANGTFTPPANCVLRFMEMPLSAIKVVILGQDPYPQPGVATGRAFEVGTLQSWNDPFKNISLKNILRALYKAYFGEALKYSEIKTRFENPNITCLVNAKFTENPYFEPFKLSVYLEEVELVKIYLRMQE